MLKFLLSKLHPELNRLFQHPLKNFSQDGIWYRKEPIGKDTMGKIMKNISKKAGLSAEYTCHCVIASTITKLLENGVDPTIVIQVTKHKNVSSLKHYVSELTDRQHQKTHDILASAMPAKITSDVVPDKEPNDVNLSPLFVDVLGNTPEEMPTNQDHSLETLSEMPEANFNLADSDDFDFDLFLRTPSKVS